MVIFIILALNITVYILFVLLFPKGFNRVSMLFFSIFQICLLLENSLQINKNKKKYYTYFWLQLDFNNLFKPVQLQSLI